jgi:hypothetical protein
MTARLFFNQSEQASPPLTTIHTGAGGRGQELLLGLPPALPFQLTVNVVALTITFLSAISG